MKRPRTLVLPALAILGPAIAGAQRAALTVGAGGGTTPDVTGFATEQQAGSLVATFGARLRPLRNAMFVDVTGYTQGEILLSDEIAMLTLYEPGHAYRRYASGVRGQQTTYGADVRIGAEARPTSAPLFRVSAGGGWTPRLHAPYTVAGVGIGTRGRRVRLTLDAERRWMRLRTEEFEPTATTTEFTVTRTSRVAKHATAVRVGLELPLDR
jgi:hypothetical protein